MSAMLPDIPRDGPDDLDDEVVGYWAGDGSTYVLQSGTGKLLLASDVVIEVER